LRGVVKRKGFQAVRDPGRTKTDRVGSTRRHDLEVGHGMVGAAYLRPERRGRRSEFALDVGDRKKVHEAGGAYPRFFHD